MKQFFGCIITLLAAFAVLTTAASAQEPASSPPPKSSPAPTNKPAAVHKSSPGSVAAEARLRAVGPILEAMRPSDTAIIVSDVTTFGFPVLIVVAVVYARYRRTRLLHETLRAMVEKGVTIPPELLVPPKPPANDFRRGVLCITLSIGLMGILWVLAGRGAWSIGLVPMMLGIGYLLVARIGAKAPTSSDAKLP